MSTILVVEDDSTLNQSLSHKLSLEGYNVVSAHNGKEGLNLLQNYSINLILMDIMMPEMDGIEMIYYWNQKQQASIPTFILTNLTEHSYPDNITKTFVKADTSLNEIVDEVKKVLGGV